MANNAFNFKGLYDKIAGLLKNSDIKTTYTPAAADYIAIYKNVPGSPAVGNNTIAMKEYVPVTEIGGGGPLPDDVMTSFNVSGTGGVTLSVDSGVTYTEGPVTIEDLDSFIINSSSVPNGLNWRGDFNSPSGTSTDWDLNDVVFTNTGSTAVYRTWFAIQTQPISGAVAPPIGDEYSNDYWALLGTQGPAGSQGPQGLPSATATFGFIPFTATGGTHTTVINISGSPGTLPNTTGQVIKVTNNSPDQELVIVIPANASQGWPDKSQITFINTSPEGNGPVKITGASGVSLNSSDDAQYLRTKNSTCSVVREVNNTYWMFGDLTNIA